MNVLDLFSGIGGFSLGLERAGMRTVAFCEIDPFCRRVLAKRWPGAPIYDDVRTLTADRLRADGIPVDLICGGFPCQDISLAGHGTGLEGERSGLWTEYARIIGEVRPRYVIVENVPNLLAGPRERPGEWFGAVLGALAALGYDAEWHCIPACALGAPHRRDRVWIVANAGSDRRDSTRERPHGNEGDALAATGALREQGLRAEGAADVADSTSVGRRSRRPRGSPSFDTGLRHAASSLAYANGEPTVGPAISWPQRNPWGAEPSMGRVVDGISYRLVEDEITALGNAVVPQIPEIIGRAIMRSALTT